MNEIETVHTNEELRKEFEELISTSFWQYVPHPIRDEILDFLSKESCKKTGC